MGGAVRRNSRRSTTPWRSRWEPAIPPVIPPGARIKRSKRLSPVHHGTRLEARRCPNRRLMTRPTLTGVSESQKNPRPRSMLGLPRILWHEGSCRQISVIDPSKAYRSRRIWQRLADRIPRFHSEARPPLKYTTTAFFGFPF
jgi:hypothetical protein